MTDPSQASGAPRTTFGRLGRKKTLFWLAAYTLLVIGVVFAMIQVRARTLRTMDTPEARAEWQAWRDAEPNQKGTGPVERRPPSATEPPALLLMRDYFGVMLSAAVVFSSLLFGAITIAARGVFATQPSPRPPGEGAERKRGG